MLLSSITAVAAKKFLVAQLPKLALGLVVIALGIFLYESGYDSAKKKYKEKIEVMKAKDLTHSMKVINAVRLQEQAIAKESVDIVSKLNEDLKNEISQKDSVISSINNGTLKLRNKFKCPAVSSTNKLTTRDNGETGEKLSKEDEKFLVSESNRADQLVDRLNSCQDLLVVLKDNYDKACK